MMRMPLIPAGIAVVLAMLLTGCGSTEAVPAADSTASESSEAATGTAEADDATNADGADDDAFSADRDQLAIAIEAAFASENGTARWEGDTLVLAIDGDASETMAGFTPCRVLAALLQPTDTSTVEFPNGSVSCADVLAED